jgi:hypothetical protein
MAHSLNLNPRQNRQTLFTTSLTPQIILQQASKHKLKARLLTTLIDLTALPYLTFLQHGLVLILFWHSFNQTSRPKNTFFQGYEVAHFCIFHDDALSQFRSSTNLTAAADD